MVTASGHIRLRPDGRRNLRLGKFVAPYVPTDPGTHYNHGFSSFNTGGPTGNIYPFGFTATAGRLLVVIGTGEVTWSTPAGWTLLDSFLPGDASYVWTKTAAGGETDFTSDHNGNGNVNFGATMEVFEYASTATVQGITHTNRITNSSLFGNVSPTSGTHSVIWAATVGKGSNTLARTGTISSGTQIMSSDVNANTDGSFSWTNYIDGLTGTSEGGASQTETVSSDTGILLTIVVGH